jgi:hypothetical protein
MRDMAGLVGADFQLALKGLEQMRQKCRDTDDALTEHLASARASEQEGCFIALQLG